MSWTAPPAGTQSFALILHDPDAPVSGGWDHWIAFNLPANLRGLAEDQPRTGSLPGGGVQGRNSWGNLGYGGPCPPPGPAHRYQFRLYALNTTLTLSAGASKQQVQTAITGRILAESLLEGTFP